MIGERIRERLEATGLSQSELARRTKVTQGTIAGLVTGRSRGSAHLHKIARELGTTPAYLAGEIDDPSAGAPPPPPEPRVQLITLPVALPSERALTAAFEGVLLASAKMSRAELARELARLLPSLLRIAGDALPFAAMGDVDDVRELAEDPANAVPARRRAASR